MQRYEQDLTQPSESLNTFVAHPGGTEPLPGVMVIHEIVGLK